VCIAPEGNINFTMDSGPRMVNMMSINQRMVMSEHSLIWSLIVCPHSNWFDRSLDRQQLDVPSVEL
jgi:hypothetical protein